MKLDLGGRRAAVTGGASGIGFAVSKAFVAAGADVAVLDRNTDGEAAASDIGAAFHALDVTDEAAVERCAEALSAEGPVDILVTSAGTLQRPLPPQELTWKEWDRITAVHQRGAFACCRSFGGRMAAAGGGAIVLVSSVSGLNASPLHAYGPSKAAIAHLAKGLAAEWGPKGVRVNAVAPGFTATPALARGLADGVLDEGRLTAETALGRLVEAEEIAEAMLFLASSAASAITGVVLPVDAGHLVASDWNVYGGLR